jgi:hypothetical protein
VKVRAWPFGGGGAAASFLAAVIVSRPSCCCWHSRCARVGMYWPLGCWWWAVAFSLAMLSHAEFTISRPSVREQASDLSERLVVRPCFCSRMVCLILRDSVSPLFLSLSPWAGAVSGQDNADPRQPREPTDHSGVVCVCVCVCMSVLSNLCLRVRSICLFALVSSL